MATTGSGYHPSPASRDWGMIRMKLPRLLRRARIQAECERDIQFYLDAEAEENMARGMAPDEARAAARRKLGNATLIREEIYEMNSAMLFEVLWRDLRYALRTMRQNPAFVGAAALAGRCRGSPHILPAGGSAAMQNAARVRLHESSTFWLCWTFNIDHDRSPRTRSSGFISSVKGCPRVETQSRHDDASFWRQHE
jgi:hypothetical protein